MDLISLEQIHSYSDYMSSYECKGLPMTRTFTSNAYSHFQKDLPDDQVEGFLPGEYRVEAQHNFHLTGLH